MEDVEHETNKNMFDIQFAKRTWAMETVKELKRFMNKIYDKGQREIKGCENCKLCSDHRKDL